MFVIREPTFAAAALTSAQYSGDSFSKCAFHSASLWIPSESTMIFGAASSVRSALSTASFGAVCLNRFRKQTVVMPMRRMTAGGIDGTPAPCIADRRLEDSTGIAPTAADNCVRNTRRFIDSLLIGVGISDV